MKFVYFTIAGLLAFGSLEARPKLAISHLERAERHLVSKEFPQAIQHLQAAIKHSPEKKHSELYLKLALAHYHDQDQEEAFLVYLKALGLMEPKPAVHMTEKEKVHYDKALALYMDQAPTQVQTSAQKIIDEFKPIVEENPEYIYLNFIVAAAEANAGDFISFFNRFYWSFQHDAKAYMAWRTKGILHLKLYERSREPKERVEHHRLALDSFKRALEKNIEDDSLYKLVIQLTKEEDKKKVLVTYLNTILEKDVSIPRSDILFYIRHAIDYEEQDLGEKVLDKVRKQYDYSRAIARAQELIDQSRGRHE